MSQRSTSQSTLDSCASWWREQARIGPNRMVLGFPQYEYLVMPSAHQYVLLAARPGMFKSTLAWNWALNLAISGKRVLWLGVEQGNALVMGWALSRMTGIPFRKLESAAREQISLHSSDAAELQACESRLATLPMVLWEKERLTEDEMVDAATKVDYDAVFLDYIGLVKAKGRNRTERVESVSEKVRAIRKAKPIHFVALAQMNREIEKTQGGKPRVPNLSDLKDSGQLEADADAVVFLHREITGPGAPQNLIQARVEKNRNGPLGIVDLIAKPETKEIHEAPPQNAPPPQDDEEEP